MAAKYIGPVLKRPQPVLVMAVAVVAMSWAAPLIRLSSAPPLAIAAWRLSFATLMLAPAYGLQKAGVEWRHVGGKAKWIAAAAGVLLALHFASWIASLRMTSIAASVVLVSLSPVFAWGLSRLALGERPSRTQAVGIALAAMLISLSSLAALISARPKPAA